MKIVADENIPFVDEVFGMEGQIVKMPGRLMTADTLEDAEVLLVRSVTKVGWELLENSRVRFVGTATIGTDHIDTDYLRNKGVFFASAAGSNANSVAEYVLLAMLSISRREKWDITQKTLGIIGVGNIGSLVAIKAAALGMPVLQNDPPLERKTRDPKFVSIEQFLAKADIITLHVPLTREGLDPTWHLFDRERIQELRPGVMLINTSRGAVVDNESLLERIQQGDLGPVVLDVWENEPDINLKLLEKVDIATPHIAGYSLDGKANGTRMLHQAYCEFRNRESTIDIRRMLPRPPVPEIWLEVDDHSDEELIRQALSRIYKLGNDEQCLREMAKYPKGEQSHYFDFLRRNYPIRREAQNTTVELTAERPQLREKLKTIGFRA